MQEGEREGREGESESRLVETGLDISVEVSTFTHFAQFLDWTL